jgi:hypothetical protein
VSLTLQDQLFIEQRMNQSDPVEVFRDIIVVKLGESPEAWRGFYECIKLYSQVHEMVEDPTDADEFLGWLLVKLLSDPVIFPLLTGNK